MVAVRIRHFVELNGNQNPSKRVHNKQAASRYRKKKKDMFLAYKEQVEVLTRENASLQAKCEKLTEILRQRQDIKVN